MIYISFLITLLHLFYLNKYNISIRTFIRQNCLLNRSLACFGGKYRRNVFTMTEIYFNLNNLLLFTIVYNILIWCFQYYCDKIYRSYYYIIHNLFYLFFVDPYNIVFIPCWQIYLCSRSIWLSENEPNQVTIHLKKR